MKKRHLLKLLIANIVVCVTMAFAADSDVIKGNKDSKIYHNPSCKHYTAKGSTETFVSEAAATEAGFKACEKCDTVKPAKKIVEQKK